MMKCDKCGGLFPEHEIDAKPSSAAFNACSDQPRALEEAADRGDDFDRFECGGCYGPGYIKGDAP